MGKFLFYALWPLIWLYAPIIRRVRVVIIYKNQYVGVVNNLSPRYWQLPGGGIKFGESVQAAALREVDEELGINLKKVTLLHEHIQIVKQFGLLLRYHFVFVEVDSKKELICSSELVDAAWRNLDDTTNSAREILLGLQLYRDRR